MYTFRLVESWLTFLPTLSNEPNFYPRLHINFNIPMYKYVFFKFSFELVVIPNQFLINELNKIFNFYSLLWLHKSYDLTIF